MSAVAALDPKKSFQGLILALQTFWARQGCVILQPYDMEVGAGTFHPATTLRALGPQAVEGRLCSALAPPQGRPLRRKPQPPAALLPVPGDPEAVAGEPSGALSRLARRDRRRHGAARHAFRRGRLGEPDARRLGPRLGMLVRRHGSLAIHLFPAGRRLRMRAGVGRTDLRPRAPRHVRAGRRLASTTSISTAARATSKMSYADVFLQAEQEYSRFNFEYADTEMLFQHFERRGSRMPGAARKRRRRASAI